MTPVQFADYIRKRTKTNATTFPDADILLYANIIKDDLAKEVTKVNEDYFGMEFLRNLVAGQRKYRFPLGILNQIKYTQAKIDGTNWKRLTEFDVTSYQRPTDESSILSNWAGKDPSFDIFGEELAIYSDVAITNVTNGLKLWAIIYPKDLSSLSGVIDMSVPTDTTSFGLPRQLHWVWATKVIIEYKSSKEKPLPLTERELNVNADLQLALNALKAQNLDRTVIATVPDHSNNGQDY
jgi:hypothetical protein